MNRCVDAFRLFSGHTELTLDAGTIHFLRIGPQNPDQLVLHRQPSLHRTARTEAAALKHTPLHHNATMKLHLTSRYLSTPEAQTLVLYLILLLFILPLLAWSPKH